MNICLFTYHGDVETTSYFMSQLEQAWEMAGIKVNPIVYDIKQKRVVLDESMTQKLQEMLEASHSLDGSYHNNYFITFNFAGVYGDDLWIDENGQLMVDVLGLQVVNIIVDHPYHYHSFLIDQIENRLDRYTQVCIDKAHIEYMQKYFPMVKLGPFMPSGGTSFAGDKSVDTGEQNVNAAYVTNAKNVEKQGEMENADWTKLWQQRFYDVVFAATYVCPDYFDVFIERNGEEYALFYRSVLKEVMEDANKRLEDVMRRRLIEEIPEITEDELRETLGHMQFLDYYVRYKRREELIIKLALANIKIDIFGSGWEDLPLEEYSEKQKEIIRRNLILHPYVTSEECLEIFTKTKFVLNVLPCFHDGAHDRIFNAMQNGAICVTDSNRYLDTMLVDEENALLYNWEELEKLIEKLTDYLGLEKQEDICAMQDAAYRLAKENTWQLRAQLLTECFH